jgi:hypothetical protein
MADMLGADVLDLLPARAAHLEGFTFALERDTIR